MAEEFHTGICGGNWWMNPPRNVFVGGGASPCAAVNASDFGNYGTWMADLVDLRSRSACSKESIIHTNNNNCINSTESQSHGPTADSDNGGCGSDSILMDSTLQMMGFGISSSSSSSPDWNQTLLTGSGSSMLQEDMNNSSGLSSSTHHQIQKDWSPKSFTSSGSGEDLPINGFKPMNQDFSLDQQQRLSPGGNSTATIQGMSVGFSMGSSAPYNNHPSSVIQALFESDDDPPQQPFFNSYSSSTQNYGTHSLSELSSASWPNNKLSHPLLKPSSLTKQLQPATSSTGGLHFSNNTPFWNASPATAMINDVRESSFLLPSPQPQYIVPNLEQKPSCNNLTKKAKNEEVRDSGAVVKKASEPAYKRPRIETPSPLPTFKVRKEKLGDRITALQQLVSPFGKTDTASVLHEAIDYIKFLHDQVNVLSTPYMKNGNPIQQAADKLLDPEGLKQDLRSRGLCLVPISSTFPVASETTADFWMPTFGGPFRTTSREWNDNFNIERRFGELHLLC